MTESQSKSIAMIVLSRSSTSTNLSKEQHTLALEYLAIHLAIRDRQALINVLCYHQPDLLTSSVQDMVDVYDPIIRALHNAVDLSGGTADLQSFLHDLVEMSRFSAKSDKQAPKVEDFAKLLKKHQGSSHRFIHQALKNGKELTQWYRGYAKHAAAQYRQKSGDIPVTKIGVAAAGDLTPALEDLVSKLAEEDVKTVAKELDAHGEYLRELSKASENRMKAVIKNMAAERSDMTYGPGIFLAKWQALMDATSITPATAEGPIRHGASDSVKEATRVDVDGTRKGTSAPLDEKEASDSTPPDVTRTLRLLQSGFKELLVQIAKDS